MDTSALDASAAAPPVIQATALAKSFKTPQGLLQVLQDVSLTLNPCEFASIRGESGAGKTTLLQVLGGLDRPSSGELLWNNERICGRSNAFLARRRARWLGFIFQSYHLIPELTARENILLAGSIAGSRSRELAPAADALLERVGLGGRAAHLPSRLSGGECQRVAIARALLNKPRLILADEPTGNLDERTGEEIMTLLLDIVRTEKTALILVTHNTTFASLAPRRLILRHGTLHEENSSPAQS
ncbi:MAG: ABC transporter ATP-binding protein [Puniceicoccales bacterium]|jgi:ABC-type lipoprotein export system ATPase subunit|nr:ABC transporter ATP-binding protein [Puniceicoccales bacterium]